MDIKSLLNLADKLLLLAVLIHIGILSANLHPDINIDRFWGSYLMLGAIVNYLGTKYSYKKYHQPFEKEEKKN